MFTDGAMWRLLVRPESRATLKLSLVASRLPAEVNPSGNRRLAPSGQKGVPRSSRKCMNRMPEKFATVLVSPVVVTFHLCSECLFILAGAGVSAESARTLTVVNE